MGTFPNKNNLIQHLPQHTGNDETVEVFEESFICPYCEEIFTSSEDIIKHLETVHIDISLKPFSSPETKSKHIKIPDNVGETHFSSPQAKIKYEKTHDAEEENPCSSAQAKGKHDETHDKEESHS